MIQKMKWRLYVYWHRLFDDRWPRWRVCPQHADCFCPAPWRGGPRAF